MSKVIKFLENQIKICNEIGGMDSEKRAFEMTLSVAKSEEEQKVEPEDKSNGQGTRPFRTENVKSKNPFNNKENKESDTKERKSKDEDKVMEFIEEIFGKIDKPNMIDIINMAKGEFLKSKSKK